MASDSTARRPILALAPRFRGRANAIVGICLLGVAIGEGAICGIYIFLGHAALTRL